VEGQLVMNLEGVSEFRAKGVRRLAASIVAVVVVLALIAAAITGNFPSFKAQQISPKAIPPGALFVDFGLARNSLTRTLLVNANFPPGNGTVPTILNPRLVGDLRNGAGEQFPTAQATLNATAVATGRVQVSATLNPAAPERISGGTYRGTILLSSGTKNVSVPIVAFLASRENQLAVLAFLLLLLGAIVGLLVKWITEALSQLASARWRLEDLRRDLGCGSRDCLPAQVASKLEEIDRRILRQDTNGLDGLFQPITANARHLTAFANAIQNALNEVEQQVKLAETVSSDEIDSYDIYSVVQAERAEIDTFRTEDWPWSDARDMLIRVKTFAEQTHVATLAIQDLARERNIGRASAAVRYFRRGDFTNGERMFNLPTPPLPEPDDNGPKQRRRLVPLVLQSKQKRASLFARLGGGSALQWMMKRPLQFAGLASVIVVATVGLQVQYLDNNSFSGSLGDWLGLALWSAVIELSGVSVLDVLGRLGAGARPSAQAPPPITTAIPTPAVQGQANGVSVNGHGEPAAVGPPMVAGAAGGGAGAGAVGGAGFGGH
jgi:hypothetical protein